MPFFGLCGRSGLGPFVRKNPDQFVEAAPGTLAQSSLPHAIKHEVDNQAGSDLDLPMPDTSLPLRRSFRFRSNDRRGPV